MNKLTGILTVIIFFSSTLFSAAQVIALKEKISISLKNTTAAAVVEELDKRTDYTFSYTHEQLEKIKITSFVFNDVTLGSVLENLQRLANVDINLLGNTIAVKVNATPTAAPAPTGNAKPGKITGVIRNDKNEVMPGVTISVESADRSTTSSVNGEYVLSMPAGNYTLVFSFVGYQTRRITDAVIKANEITDLGVMLTAATKQMQAVVVTSGARKESTRSLLMTQKNNASMTNGISAEQIRATPDNNTGQVLRRVSGITVQNDKFVTIRGVSDRYNNVLINGASLPSTEPNRRNFSFDIVPSALLDNIVVNKTATPDLPGEFTGGLIQINTRDVPVDNFLQITVGTGYNTASSGREFVSFKRDNKASIATIDKNRKWFGDGRLMDPQEAYAIMIRNDTAAQRNIGRQVPNRWQLNSYPYTPAQNYQLAGGLNKRFGKNSLGFMAAGTYLNEQLYEGGKARVSNQFDFDSERFRYNTTIGGIFNTAFKTTRHRLSWKNLYNRRYSNQFDLRSGKYSSQGWDPARRIGEITLVNELVLTRLEGEHKFTKANLKLDWYGDYTRLDREQPDSRFMAAHPANLSPSKDGAYMYNLNDRLLLLGGLYASLLKEKKRNTGANFSVPFKAFNETQLVKIGYSWSERKADFDAGNFRILGKTNYTNALVGLPYYEIVQQSAFGNGDLWYLPASTRASSLGDRYVGKQTLQGSYAMVDLKPFSQLRLTGGVRYEDNKTNMSTAFYSIVTGDASFQDTVYHETDLLPSANIIYSVNNRFNIRLAYSKTLARPDFVERSPTVYYDFTELAEVVGEKSLEVSRIKNYDIRFEYYPSGDEIISASLFYKDFEKPVERFYFIEVTTNRVEYRNLYNAQAKGFEVDIRKSMGFINPANPWLQRLFISANYTWLQGNLKAQVTSSPFTGKDTSYIDDQKRPIQGLSPYIINGALNYQTKLWGLNLGYNRIGRRIVNGGINHPLIQYENPRDVLDLQLNVRPMKQRMEIKLNISDILNQPYIIYSNTDASNGVDTAPGPNNDPKGNALNEGLDLVNYKVKRGTGISISISYRF
jgi:TonB-dependent receptor